MRGKKKINVIIKAKRNNIKLEYQHVKVDVNRNTEYKTSIFRSAETFPKLTY